MSMIDARALFERVVGTFPPDKARPIWETWANYEYNFGDLGAAAKLEKRIADVYPDGASSCLHSMPFVLSIRLAADLPMRRFAQRHVYSNHDAIAIRDLGWMPAGSSGSSNGSLKHDNGLAVANSASASSLGGVAAQKRPAGSPDRGKSGVSRSMSQDMGPPPQKRARELSPSLRDRERDRRDRERDRRDMPPPPPRRRYGSPDWGRGSPPRRGGDGHRDWDRDSSGHDDRGASGVPGLTSFFMNQLPPSSTFDGRLNTLSGRVLSI
jgi:cleavage stimulation factor subunit 3